MSRVFLLATLFLNISNLRAFDYSDEFTLKKDQIAKVLIIKKEYKKRSEKSGELIFRWTLYKNDSLVLLVSYEGFPTQHILKKLHQRDSIRVDLIGDYVRFDQKVYLILKFSDFQKDKKTANFTVMISDAKKRVEVEFMHPKRKND